MRHLRDNLVVALLILVLAPALFFTLYTFSLLDTLLRERGEERLTLHGQQAQARYLQARRAGAATALLDSDAVAVDTDVVVLQLADGRSPVPRALWDGVQAGDNVLVTTAVARPYPDGLRHAPARLLLWRTPDGPVLALVQQVAEEAARRQRVLIDTLAWSGVFIAFALLLALLLARRLTRPVLFLQRWAEQVERGERSATLRITRRDELGRLAASLQRMSERLNEQIGHLQELRQYNDCLIESMFSGLVTLEADGRLRALNGRARQLLALPDGDLRGRPYPELFAAQPDLQRVMHATLARGREAQREEISVSTGGGERTFGISSNRLRSADGAVHGAAFFFQDLTEIKELERRVRQQEKLAALGEMAAAVAHEVRNPLNPIRGFAQLLQEEDDPAEARQYAGIIISQVDALRRLVDNLLLYARPGDVTASDLDVADLVTESLTLHRQQCTEKELRVQAAVPAPLPWRTGLAQLRMIIDNLVRNAVAVLPAGGLLRVTAAAADGWLTVTVTDDGPGIAPEHQPHLFTAFFTTRAQGTGLGLALVKKMTDDCGGTVSVVSRPGAGAAFTVRLPWRNS